MRGAGEVQHNISISVPKSTPLFPASPAVSAAPASGMMALPSAMPTLNFGVSLFGGPTARPPNVLADEAKKKADEEAKKKTEEEAKKKAEEEAKKKAEEEAKKKAEEEAKKKAEEEAKKKAEEEAKKKAEEEAKKKAEEEAKKKAEEEEAKKKAEEEAKKKAEADMNKEDEITEQISQLNSTSGGGFGFGTSTGFGTQSNAFAPKSPVAASPGQTSTFGGGLST